MRRILVERARCKGRLKREGRRHRIHLDTVYLAFETPAEDLLALDEAVETLSAEYPDCAELVKLRFFAGLSQGDAAAALGLPRRTADRHWAFARAWLYDQLNTPTTHQQGSGFFRRTFLRAVQIGPQMVHYAVGKRTGAYS